MDKNKETEAKKLQKKLISQKKNAYLKLDDGKVEKIFDFSEDYKKFLDKGKTERECVTEAVKLAIENGFEEYDASKKYKAGDKLYFVNRHKCIILTVIGTEPIEKGINISAAHIDSPRIDLKQNPLYEDGELGYFKNHYYGGIKKYQWTAMPLSLHGVIYNKEGEKLNIVIGEDETDPVFCVTDLLPHLAGEQMKKPLSEAIKGEELNLLIGSRPFKDDDISEKVKLNLMNLLFEKYGIVEDDFLSAELEIVPAYKAKDIGFDRSMIGAYGQDDRVCAYTSLKAILKCKNPAKTAMCVLSDKEEVGSDGNTGLQSAYMKYFIADIAAQFGVEGRTVLSNSECLSADVNAAFDPTFPDVSEKRNCSLVNYGVVVTKYTGARGKSGTSDASAEFVHRVRTMLDDNNVIWQTGELGKVDAGGGGTVAAYIANLNVDVIDVGVPVISMHAPFEVTSKVDVYMAYKAFSVFFSEK